MVKIIINKKNVLLIILIISWFCGSSQIFKINYNQDINVKEIIPTDTIVWQFIDSTQYEKIYPVNCDVLLDNVIELHTCNLKHQNEKNNYELRFSKSSFSLRIDAILNLNFNKGVCNGKVCYYEAADGEDRVFKIVDCDLKLNKKSIEVGDIVQGSISIKFNGVYANLETGKTIKKPGFIKGTFYVKAN